MDFGLIYLGVYMQMQMQLFTIFALHPHHVFTNRIHAVIAVIMLSKN